MSWSWPHRHRRRRREDDTPLGWRAITHAMRRLGLDTSIIDHQPGIIGSGRLTVAADGPRITVNADMSTENKLMTVAHMLGHIDYNIVREGDAAVITLPIGYSLPCHPLFLVARGIAATDDDEERHAIAFANTTLMPARLVMAMWANADDPADMAAAIGVDFDTMSRRIVALGLRG